MDVLVVGAGPIGLETAVVLAAEGHDVLTVDRGPVGATILRTFPPNTRFFTSPERLQIRGHSIQTVAQEKLTGEEYLAYLRALVQTTGIRVRTYCQVINIAGTAGPFEVLLREASGAQTTVTADTLVMAGGDTDRPRRLGVAGEDLPHVHRALGQPHRFFGRRVLVVGGRNSAAESAVRLYRIGADVSLSYRRADLAENVKFWIRPELRALIAEGAITGYLPSSLHLIEPGRVTLTDGRHIDVDDVLLQIGFEQDKDLFAMAGVDLVDAPGEPPRLDPATQQSNVAGIYVVGTATAGTQDGFTTFIENCHQHADRVAAALAGRSAPAPVAPRPLPES